MLGKKEFSGQINLENTGLKLNRPPPLEGISEPFMI